jgi:hypothetical protein
MVQSSTDGKGTEVGDAVDEMTDTLNKWKNLFGRGRQHHS